MKTKKVKVEDLIPYENNPRNNDGAVEAVAESIRQCGYCQPIVVDENMVILAGHTRLKALQRLGWDDCEVIVEEGLTEAKKRKYRLLDNKTAEFSKWDYDLLEQESQSLDFEGYDFGFGSLLEARGKMAAGHDKVGERNAVNGICICPRCGAEFKEGEDDA